MDDDEKYRAGRASSPEVVRVIGADGSHRGVFTIEDAFRLETYGLDLVEIDPRATPPVWQLIDWAQFSRWREAN